MSSSEEDSSEEDSSEDAFLSPPSGFPSASKRERSREKLEGAIGVVY